MENLMQLRIFSLVSEKIENENVLKDAYNEFAQSLQKEVVNNSSLSNSYYGLGYINLELIGLQHIVSSEKGKNIFAKGYFFN
ncbi:MAG: hypothetical protein LBT43_18100 [Prevotella sp.]|jgi:hypothetical protein|nr:hypothetical protein [Prevotella sp.]